jgi:hypothetical protein
MTEIAEERYVDLMRRHGKLTQGLGTIRSAVKETYGDALFRRACVWGIAPGQHLLRGEWIKGPGRLVECYEAAGRPGPLRQGPDALSLCPAAPAL